MDSKRAGKKKKKQKRKAAPPRELVREAKKYAGPVAGAVFTTVRGVTGYYSDGPRAANAAPPMWMTLPMMIRYRP